MIFVHQGVSLKDRCVFFVEKDAFSSWRHFPRHDSRDIASLSTVFGYSDLSHVVLRFHYPCIDIGKTEYRSKNIPGLGYRETPLGP
jgi:hypothetical protein